MIKHGLIFISSFLIVAVFPYLASCQPNYTKTVIPDQGRMVDDFVPKGWSIQNSESGDLNNDAIPDYVILLKRNELNSDDNPNEKILLIILFDKTSQEYIRAVQDESMTVELTRESNLEENEFKLLILKGSLQIYFSNPRPGLDRDITYYFSFVNKRFRLTKETVKMQFMASGKRESSQKDFSRLGPLFIDNFYFSELITR